MAEELHTNFLSAKAMVEESMESPSKTVKYLPVFMRVFPTEWVDSYKKDSEDTVMVGLKSKYCLKACEGQAGQCKDQCQQFYNNSITSGLDVIRKVHKQYKLQTLEEDE